MVPSPGRELLPDWFGHEITVFKPIFAGVAFILFLSFLLPV